MPESVDRIQAVDIRETIGFEGVIPETKAKGNRTKTARFPAYSSINTLETLH